MKKFFCTLLFVFLAAACVFAVEWPQEDKSAESIMSYFGQNIEGNISKSLIFTEPSEVKAVKDGRILIVMSDIEDDSEFFPSALGACVILAHDDDLISVYANLDKDTIQQTVQDKSSASEGEIIAETGNTGWQKNRSSLEFQIIDTQKSAAINPKILLPRTENEKPYSLTGVILKNKEGTVYDLRENKIFPSGSYKIYHTRNKIAVPYKITATLNGVVRDEIAFDTVGMQNGKLYVTGKNGDKLYTASEIYPDDNTILCGDIMLTPGKFTLAIEIEDFLGKISQVSYILSIY